MLGNFNYIATYLLIILICCCSTRAGGYSREQRRSLLDTVHLGFEDPKNRADQRTLVDVSQTEERHQRSIDRGNNAAKSKTYVLRGRLAVLNYIAGRKEHVLLDPVIEWSGSSGKPLNDGRYKITETGTLTIADSEAKDSGEYTCAVKGTDNTGKNVKRTFRHTLVVFILPELNYLITLKYKAASCDEALKNYKMTQIKSKLCKGQECYARDVSARCHSQSEDATIQHQLWMSFTVVPANNIDIPDCSISCMRATVMRVLNTRLLSVKEFVQKESDSQRSKLTITPSDMTIKLHSPCPSGNKKDNIICVACGPGSYSQDKEDTCSLCEKGTYQEQFAMKDCSKCEGVLSTLEEGAASKDQCVKLDGLSESIKRGLTIGVCVFVALVVLVIGGGVFKMYLNSKKKDGKKKTLGHDGHASGQASKPLLTTYKESSQVSLYLPQRKSHQKKNKPKKPPKKESKSKGYTNPRDKKVATYVSSVAKQQANSGFEAIPSDHIYMSPIPSSPARNPNQGNATNVKVTDIFDDHIYDTINPDPHYMDWSELNDRPPEFIHQLAVSHSYKSPEELYRDRQVPPAIPPPRRSTQSMDPQHSSRR